MTQKQLSSNEQAPVLTATGLEANTKFVVTLHAEADGNAAPLAKKEVETDDKGELSVPLETSQEEAAKATGTVTVSVNGSDNGVDQTQRQTFSVAKNPAGPSDPTLSVKQDVKFVSQFRDHGYTVNYANLKESEKYTWTLNDGSGEVEASGTFTADKGDGSFNVAAPKDSDEASLPGKYTVTLKNQNGVLVDATETFTVVEED